MSDIGLTHVALPVSDIAASVHFYAAYANLEVVHQRKDEATGSEVVWLSDHTRPFVIVLISAEKPEAQLRPFAHLGVGCATRDEVDRLANHAREEGILVEGPKDYGYPVGYWAFISDPDGNTLELSCGQEVGLTVEQSSP
ncbi:MAG TPA: VOC family protein [Blastocatellia bacterium]|nr:VOC family protein [Blastocatellia bacterium]